MNPEKSQGTTLTCRRSALKLSVGFGLSLIPVLQARAAVTTQARRLKFLNLHTGERLRATYWEEGRFVKSELASIDHILRDFRTDETRPIDPRLLNMLHTLQQRMESGGWIKVISGYRSPRTNAVLAKKSTSVARKSLHMKGMAIDVAVSDQTLVDVRKAALSLRAGGVGYYPKSGFVHLDTGRVRRW